MARYWQLLVKAQGDTKSAEYAMTRLQRQTNKLGRDIRSMGMTLTAGLTAPLTAAGIASIKLASDADETASKLQVTFGKATRSITSDLDKFAKVTGSSRYVLREQAATIGALLKPMKLGEKAMQNMTISTVKLAKDLSSFHNIAEDDALDKLRAGLTGESEPLKAMGILINDNAIKEEAYARGIAKRGAVLTEQQKVQARYSLILKQSADAVGDAERTSESFSNQVKALKNALRDLGIDIGRILIPHVIKIVKKMNDLIVRFQGFSSEQKKLAVGFGLIVAAIGPVMIGLGALVSAFASLLPVFKALRIALIAQKALWVGTKAVVLGYRAAVVAATLATKALNLAFKLSPVGRIIALIGLLAAALVVAWKKSERFRDFVKGAFEKVKLAAQALPIVMRTVGSAIIDGIKRGAKEKAKQLLLYVANLGLKLVGTIKEKLGIKSPSRVFARQVGAPIVEGIVLGIRNNVEKASKAMDALADRMTATIAKRLRKSDLRQAFLDYRLAEASFTGQETMGILRRQLQGVLQRIKIIKDFLRKNARKLRIEARIDLLGQLSSLFGTAVDIKNQMQERASERPAVQRPVIAPPAPPSVAARPLPAVSGGTVSNTYNVTVNAQQPVDTLAFMRNLRVAARMGTV